LKWKIVFSALLALGVAGYLFFNSQKGIEAPVLEVQPGSIAATFKEEGVVVAGSEQNVLALYGGEISAVTVSEGQQVRAGDLLAEINTREIDFQLQQLQAQLKSVRGQQSGAYQKPYAAEIASQRLLVERAENDLAAYQTNLKRIEELYTGGAVSEKDLQDARQMASGAANNLALQQQALRLLDESSNPQRGTAQFFAGQIEALEAQIDLLEYQKQKNRITAAISGVVGNVTVKVGDLVATGSPLLHIFKTGSYKLEVFVLAADVASVRPGMAVDLILETKDGDHVFPGQVKRIAPSAVAKTSALGLEEQRVKVTIVWTTTGGVKLFPGYRMDAEFTTDQRKNVLIVPKVALFPYEDGDAVWLVQEGKAVIRPVRKGFETNRDVVVEEGLAAGDLIIINPQLEGLTEGKKITAAQK